MGNPRALGFQHHGPRQQLVSTRSGTQERATALRSACLPPRHATSQGGGQGSWPRGQGSQLPFLSNSVMSPALRDTQRQGSDHFKGTKATPSKPVSHTPGPGYRPSEPGSTRPKISRPALLQACAPRPGHQDKSSRWNSPTDRRPGAPCPRGLASLFTRPHTPAPHAWGQPAANAPVLNLKQNQEQDQGQQLPLRGTPCSRNMVPLCSQDSPTPTKGDTVAP